VTQQLTVQLYPEIADNERYIIKSFWSVAATAHAPASDAERWKTLEKIPERYVHQMNWGRVLKIQEFVEGDTELSVKVSYVVDVMRNCDPVMRNCDPYDAANLIQGLTDHFTREEREKLSTFTWKEILEILETKYTAYDERRAIS